MRQRRCKVTRSGTRRLHFGKRHISRSNIASDPKKTSNNEKSSARQAGANAASTFAPTGTCELPPLKTFFFFGDKPKSVNSPINAHFFLNQLRNLRVDGEGAVAAGVHPELQQRQNKRPSSAGLFTELSAGPTRRGQA